MNLRKLITQEEFAQLPQKEKWEYLEKIVQSLTAEEAKELYDMMVSAGIFSGENK